MGSSVSKPIEPPVPPPNPIDLINVLTTAKPPTFEEIAIDGASGNIDSAAAKTVQLAIANPGLFSPKNLAKIFKNITGMGESPRRRKSFGRKKGKRSLRRQSKKKH